MIEKPFAVDDKAERVKKPENCRAILVLVCLPLEFFLVKEKENFYLVYAGPILFVERSQEPVLRRTNGLNCPILLRDGNG